MRRLGRIFFNLVPVLLLIVLACAIWLVGNENAGVNYGGNPALWGEGRRIVFQYTGPARWNGARLHARGLLIDAGPPQKPFGIVAASSIQTYRVEVSFLWILIVVVIGISAWFVRRHKRLTNEQCSPKCPTCNYDLRATPNRCPECGTTAHPTPPNATPHTTG